MVVAIPAFNEEKNIAKVVIGAKKQALKVIVCDDGSTDMTGTIAEELGATVIRHATNQGKGQALRTLFDACRQSPSDIVVTIDGDGQNNPAEIPLLIRPIEEKKADIVVGSRPLTGKGGVPKNKQIGNRLLSSASLTGITDTQSGFRAYSRRAIAAITPTEFGMGVDSEILMEADHLGFKILEVPISVSYETGRPSRYNPVQQGLDVLLSTVKRLSIRRPLLFYGGPGIVLLVVALVFWYWSITEFVAHRSILTNVALVGGIATVVGFVLLAVAVILWVIIAVVREGPVRNDVG